MSVRVDSCGGCHVDTQCPSVRQNCSYACSRAQMIHSFNDNSVFIASCEQGRLAPTHGTSCTGSRIWSRKFVHAHASEYK
eukprot:6201298-Pleurochrysis_carterae.AAC.4